MDPKKAASLRNAKVAHAAHKFVETYLQRYAYPIDPGEVSATAAAIAGLANDRERDLFYERAVGHFINVKAGTSGY